MHPAGHGDDAGDFTSAPLWACGILKRARSRERGGAAARRLFMANVEHYRQLRPELDLGGDAPLEAYERQAAHYTWRHEFLDASWLDVPKRPPAWLWIRTASSGLVVAAEWPEKRP